MRGAGRGFSILSAGFGCEAGMDAWVGVAIQMILPPQPVRAAWWQPTLLIHVAWVRRVRNAKQVANMNMISAAPFGSLIQGDPPGMLRLPLW